MILSYSYYAYAFAILSLLLREEVEKTVTAPELRIFNLTDSNLAWALPALIMAGVYVATRWKHWYIEEGDLVFNFTEWAHEANDRLAYIENAPEREEENFIFYLGGVDHNKDTVIDYSNPNELQK